MALDQSLFLATVIPSPSRWRGRLDANGDARRYVKAQMHFIGRAMIAKGWLIGSDSGAKPPQLDQAMDRDSVGATHGRE